MNAELFGRLLLAMGEVMGNRLLDPDTTNMLMDAFTQAQEVWSKLPRDAAVDDDDE